MGINENYFKLEEQIKETLDYIHDCDKLKKRNSELQKQVDELEIVNSNLVKRINRIGRDKAKEIYQEIAKSDILVVETQEYGEIEVVPIERLKEIIKSKGEGTNFNV